MSGGCGAMLHINVTSSAFVGKSKVQQHRMINEVIKGENLHGFRLETKELA